MIGNKDDITEAVHGLDIFTKIIAWIVMNQTSRENLFSDVMIVFLEKI